MNAHCRACECANGSSGFKSHLGHITIWDTIPRFEPTYNMTGTRRGQAHQFIIWRPNNMEFDTCLGRFNSLVDYNPTRPNQEFTLRPRLRPGLGPGFGFRGCGQGQPWGPIRKLGVVGGMDHPWSSRTLTQGVHRRGRDSQLRDSEGVRIPGLEINFPARPDGWDHSRADPAWYSWRSVQVGPGCPGGWGRVEG